MHNLTLTSQNQTIEIKGNQNYTYSYTAFPNTELNSKLTFIFDKGVTNKVIIKVVAYPESTLDLDVLIKIPLGSTLVDTYLKIDILELEDNGKKPAHIRIIPSLEIQEDNVKAGHGASISRVNVDQLYYLLSRGLEKHVAENLIVEYFLNENSTDYSQDNE